MPEYLLQDFMNERGYIARPGRPKATEAAVALAPDGRVIFGDPKTARSSYAKPGSKLIYYDDEVERQRRLVCDSALGQLMLDNPKFAQPGVDSVSRGIEAYWQQLSDRLSGPDAFQKIVETDGKYVSNPTSFGRLPVPPKPSSAEVNQFKFKIDQWLSALKGNDLPQIMTLHDTFLKVYCSNQKGVGKPMELATKYGLREEWYEGAERGRENRGKDSFKPTGMPGLLSNDFTIPYVPSLDRSGIDFANMRLEERNRGTDMFMIAAKGMRAEFRQVLGESNLVFAASASGTTSTLLTSAKTFQPTLLENPESAKQYLMGCVAYLVGGGMHTSHEVFYTGGKVAGVNYTTGKYIDMLPRTFTSSRLYEHWSSEYWDLVRPDRPSPR